MHEGTSMHNTKIQTNSNVSSKFIQICTQVCPCTAPSDLHRCKRTHSRKHRRLSTQRLRIYLTCIQSAAEQGANIILSSRANPASPRLGEDSRATPSRPMITVNGTSRLPVSNLTPAGSVPSTPTARCTGAGRLHLSFDGSTGLPRSDHVHVGSSPEASGVRAGGLSAGFEKLPAGAVWGKSPPGAAHTSRAPSAHTGRAFDGSPHIARSPPTLTARAANGSAQLERTHGRLSGRISSRVGRFSSEEAHVGRRPPGSTSVGWAAFGSSGLDSRLLASSNDLLGSVGGRQQEESTTETYDGNEGGGGFVEFNATIF